MKQTKQEDIKKEEREFLGKELHHGSYKDNYCGYENMTAEIMTATPYREWVRGAAYATFATWDCTCCKPLDDMSFEEMEEKLLSMLKKRPISVATESAKFTVRLTGVSRAITHQLVRHRRMAFGQQSLRVSDPGQDPIRLPQSLDFAEGEDLFLEMVEVLSELKPLYYKLIKNGVPPEQARNVLPIGITTKIVVTLDLREVIAYFRARTSSIAQDEHTQLVFRMMKAFERQQPEYWSIIDGSLQ